MRLVGSGDGNMGIAYGGDLHQGYFGEEDFAGAPQTNLRAVGLLFWGYSHLVVLKDAGIQSVADLANKRIAIGGTGSGRHWRASGSFRHFRPARQDEGQVLGGAPPQRHSRTARSIVTHWQSGAPNAAVLDTVATHSIALLDLAAPAKASAFADRYPYYLLGENPAGRKGIEKPVPTVLTGTYWIVHKDVPDDLVYEMTRVAYSDEGYQFMKQTFRLADMTREQALKGLTVPLHPGAQRFWQEVGVPIPDNLRAR